MNKRKFCLTIDKKEIAMQVAHLLNVGGQLGFTQRYYSILNSEVMYYIELDGEKVIGVIGVEKKNPDVSELKHLCVHPDYRNRGIGKRLMKRVVKNSATDAIYEVVRENNYPNIHNSLKLGFKPIAKCQGISGTLIVFARRKDGTQNGYCR